MSNWEITKRLFMAPIMGAAFVMFLPFIGIAMFVWFGVKKAWSKLRSMLAWPSGIEARRS